MHEREMGEDWYRDDRFIIVKRKKAPKPTQPAGLLPLTHSIYLCILSCKIHCVAWDYSCHWAYFVLLPSFTKLLVLSLCRGLFGFLKWHGALQLPSTLSCALLPWATEMDVLRQMCRTGECGHPRTPSRTTDTNHDCVLVTKVPLQTFQKFQSQVVEWIERLLLTL